MNDATVNNPMEGSTGGIGLDFWKLHVVCKERLS